MLPLCVSKAQPSKTFQVLCFATPSPAKYAIYFEFESSTERSIAFTVFSAVCENRLRAYIIVAFVSEGPAQQSITFIVSVNSEGKISVALLCFRRLSRAKCCICHVFEALALQSITFTRCHQCKALHLLFFESSAGQGIEFIYVCNGLAEHI